MKKSVSQLNRVYPGKARFTFEKQHKLPHEHSKGESNVIILVE